MAMIKCTECGKEISSNAKRCPHCGGKTEYAENNAFGILIIIVVICLVVIGFGIYKKQEKEFEEEYFKTFGNNTQYCQELC